MASPDLVRKVPPDIHYDSHPNQKVGAVICLLCDKAFYKSEFVRKFNKGLGRFITRSLIVCDSCQNTTAKTLEKDNSKFIIASLKEQITQLKEPAKKSSSLPSSPSFESQAYEELLKKYNKLKVDHSTLNNKCETLRTELDISTSGIRKSMTMQTDESVNQEDTSVDLSLWRSLVKEMSDKNELLVEKNQRLESELENLKGPKVHSTHAQALLFPGCSGSYAQMAAKSRNTGAPLIVNLKNKNDNQATEKLKKIMIANKAQVELIEGRNGKLIIKGPQINDLLAIQQKISNDMPTEADASIGKLHNPRIKVAGIAANFTHQELQDDLIARNNIQDDKSLMVKHTYLRNGKTTAILEVTSTAHLCIMQTKRLFVGWQKCPVCDEYNVSICFKCCGFNHTSTRCTRKEVCGKCSGEHRTADCQSQEVKCSNCTISNMNHGTCRKTDHKALDFRSCETYKNILEKKKRMINYPEVTHSL